MRSFVHVPILCCGLALVAVFSAPLSAQLRHEGRPAAGLDGPVPSYAVPVPDVAALRAEDALREEQGIGPLRFGAFLRMALPFHELARWQVSADGTQLAARLKLQGPGAFSLSVEFSRYELPPGGKLFVYNEAQTRVLGAYTAENRIGTGEFVIEPFRGDTLILEYTQPIAEPTRPRIEISGVTYDYADLFGMENGLASFGSSEGGAEGNCGSGANCPEGLPFPNQKRAAIRTVFQGALCSAVVLGNTARDGVGYLYTANHCGTNSTVVMYFNYEQPECDAGLADLTQTLQGAIPLANDPDSDGRLLQIFPGLPYAYHPYLAGWTIDDADLQFGLSFHHLGGGPKQVSIDENGAGQGVASVAGLGVIQVWNAKFDVGGAGFGSSGGPLFDENGLVRGALTGGPADCSKIVFGRFHTFWNNSGLAQFLDEADTGLTSVEGFDLFGDFSAAQIGTLTPTSGPMGGFTQVEIAGTGLDGVTEVNFGGVAAKEFEVVSKFLITALTPPGSHGSVDVEVTDGFGTDVLPGGFSYGVNPPISLSAVAPDTATISGQLDVLLTGTGVVGVEAVSFGGVPSPSFEVLDETTLRVSVPAAAVSGAVDLSISGPNGGATLVDGFVYTNPGEFISFGVSDGPVLSGAGSTVPGEPTGFTLTVVPGGFGQPGALFLSLSEAAVPFKQSVLYPFPVFRQINFVSGLFGTTTLGPFVMPADVPSANVVITQAAFASQQVAGGVALSNGLRILVGDG